MNLHPGSKEGGGSDDLPKFPLELLHLVGVALEHRAYSLFQERVRSYLTISLWTRAPSPVFHTDRCHMSEILPSSFIVVVMFIAFAVLGMDTLLTRVCPECRKRCKRDRSEKSRKVYRCTGCSATLLGSKPRE